MFPKPIQYEDRLFLINNEYSMQLWDIKRYLLNQILKIRNLSFRDFLIIFKVDPKTKLCVIECNIYTTLISDLDVMTCFFFNSDKVNTKTKVISLNPENSFSIDNFLEEILSYICLECKKYAEKNIGRNFDDDFSIQDFPELFAKSCIIFNCADNLFNINPTYSKNKTRTNSLSMRLNLHQPIATNYYLKQIYNIDKDNNMIRGYKYFNKIDGKKIFSNIIDYENEELVSLNSIKEAIDYIISLWTKKDANKIRIFIGYEPEYGGHIFNKMIEKELLSTKEMNNHDDNYYDLTGYGLVVFMTKVDCIYDSYNNNDQVPVIYAIDFSSNDEPNPYLVNNLLSFPKIFYSVVKQSIDVLKAELNREEIPIDFECFKIRIMYEVDYRCNGEMFPDITQDQFNEVYSKF